MLYALPEKFDNYVFGRRVSKNIPDDLLSELREFNEKLKKKTGRDHFDFPDKTKAS